MEFHLFGAVEVTSGGASVNLGRRRERGLLAVLVIDVGRFVPADRLIDLLCTDDPPPQPRNALRVHVSRLRKALAKAEADKHGVRLVGRADGYALLADPESVDLHRFTRLVADARGCADAAERARILDTALALRRGPLCVDLTSERLREYLDSRLDETVLRAVELWAETELELGRHDELMAELDRLADRHPTRESLVAAHMVALYRSGRPADALAVYHATAATLAETFGADPGPELRRLHADILRQDPGLTAPVRRRAPAQLPHDVAGFTGREAELAELTSLLTAGAGTPVTICAVDGAAGVGKTALAVHVAHHVSEHFADGQLYVDLHGFDPGHPPLPPAEALARFLRVLGVPPDQVPHDSAERAVLFRSTLAGRHMLVLLDNAATPDQVRPLLPGMPGCQVLVTSRNRLDGLRARDGAHRVTLDVLTAPEASTLLARIVGEARVAAEPEATAELARLCGHLPLALRIAAEQVADRQGAALSSLVTELSTAHNRLDLLSADGDGVRPVLTWSYRALDPASAKVFRRLGLHAGTEFSAAAAAALTGLPLDTITPVLDRLTGVHLLERRGGGRYQLHDLVRLYAAERAGAEETEQDRDEAVRRSLTWYLHTADAAGHMLLPGRRRAELTPAAPGGAGRGFDSREAALDWCETESANMVAAVRQAAATGHDAIAWQLPVALWDFLVLRRYRMDWLAIYRLGLAAARRAGDRFGEAAVLTCLGHGYWETRRFPEALRTSRSALASWRKLDDRWGEGIALHLMGGAYLGLGRVDESVDHYRQALGVHRGIGKPMGHGLDPHHARLGIPGGGAAPGRAGGDRAGPARVAGDR